ncbi:hypothetical protein AAFF_G00364680, partial [Aldrovandia affinis]
TILGSEEFISEISSTSVTLKSEERQGEVCGKRVTVVDTPGLFNTDLSRERLREEMERCVSLCDPGPHAFLLVIQLGRFTEQEKRVMETLQELFSERVNQYTVVLFSYGDRLRNTTIDQFISNDTNLQQLLKNCSGLYHVFNNEGMKNRSQVTELLQKIDKMVVENGGGCYTNEYRKTEEGQDEEEGETTAWLPEHSQAGQGQETRSPAQAKQRQTLRRSSINVLHRVESQAQQLLNSISHHLVGLTDAVQQQFLPAPGPSVPPRQPHATAI